MDLTKNMLIEGIQAFSLSPFDQMNRNDPDNHIWESNEYVA